MFLQRKALSRLSYGVSAVLGITLVLVIACSGDGGSQNGTDGTSPTPLPTGTITASGEIAYITADGHVALTDPTGASTQVISDFDGVTDIAWSADGAWIAAEFGGGVAVLSPAGDELFHIDDAVDPVWSPQVGRLSVIRADDVVVVDGTGTELHVLEQAARPEWSPDGSKVAYLKIGDDGLAVPAVLDVETGEEGNLGADVEPAEPVYPIAWHPAGEVIAYRNMLFEPSTGTTVPLEGVPVEWSPDGRLLLQTLGPDESGGTNAQLFDFSQDGRPIIGLVVRPSPQGEPAWLYVQRWIDWSLDSRTLLYLDPAPNRVRARVYDTVALRQDIFRGVEGVDPDISPSGTHAAFSQGEKLWVFALDGTALVNIVDGTKPAWRPPGQP